MSVTPAAGHAFVGQRLAKTGRARRAAAAGRRATWWLRSAPAFVIVGVPRPGTTSLHGRLAAHPSLAAAREKELHYLSSNWGRGWHWCRGEFAVRRPGRYNFEASPGTLSRPLAARRAATALPNARFIVLLREPVARLVSHYRYFQQLGIEPASLAEALAREPDLFAAGREKVLAGAPRSRLPGLRVSPDRSLCRAVVGLVQPPLSEPTPRRGKRDDVSPTTPRVRGGAALVGIPTDAGELPALNASTNIGDLAPALIEDLHAYYAPHNEGWPPSSGDASGLAQTLCRSSPPVSTGLIRAPSVEP